MKKIFIVILLLATGINADWKPSIKEKLDAIIKEGSRKNLPVVFDFDNTLFCGDIGQIVLKDMMKKNKIKVTEQVSAISPIFFYKEQEISLNKLDLYEYYEKLHSINNRGDSVSFVNAYAWSVQIFAGLSPSAVVESTKSAYEGRSKEKIYDEMLFLISEVIKNEYDVYVISGSNVWTVRWMVQNVINPELANRGIKNGIKLSNVFGISTFMLDKDKNLVKDFFYVRDNPDYAKLDKETLNSLTLTNMLSYPLTSYAGKAGLIMEHIKGKPYIVAGDSSNDFYMLSIAEHPIWIERLNKPDYQKEKESFLKERNLKDWISQPVDPSKECKFISK